MGPPFIPLKLLLSKPAMYDKKRMRMIRKGWGYGRKGFTKRLYRIEHAV